MGYDASDLRRLHAGLMLRRLLSGGPASRVELARHAGVSKPTAGQIINDLIDRKVLWESTKENAPNAGPGRPSVPVDLVAEKRFVAIAIGVKKTRLSDVALRAPTPDEWQVEFETPARPDRFLPKLQEAAAQLQEIDEPLAVLVSVPGIFDDDTGESIFSPNLRWTTELDLKQVFQQVWNLPVVFLQEIRCLAVGHQMATGDDDFLLVDVGDGLGGSAVLNGRVYRGPTPMCASVGHTHVPGQMRRCGCGSQGCLETLLSESGLIASWSAAKNRLDGNWERLIEDIGDECPEWIKPTLEAAASVFGGAMNIFGVRHLVITGLLSDMPPVIQEYLADSVMRYSLWAKLADIDISFRPGQKIMGLVAEALDKVVVGAQPDRPLAAIGTRS